MSETSTGPVLVHGFTGSSESWGEGIVDGLTAAGHPPSLLDLPGHGRDARQGGARGVAATLDGALGVIGGAVGEGRADVVGYSMGGRLALHFAVEHAERVRRLVLESASPGLATEAERSARRATDEELATFLLARGVEAFVDRWEAQPLFASQSSIDARARARQRRLRLRNEPSALAAALRGLGTGALPSLWERLGEVVAPTLLLVGELDGKFVEIAERMATRIPDARVVVVPGAGHTVHSERPVEWLAAVTGFLGSTAVPAGENP